MVEPEFSIATANAQGVQAARTGQARNQNPYTLDGTQAALLIQLAWFLGYDSVAQPGVLVPQYPSGVLAVTPAQIRTLNSAPLTILPGVPGRTIVPIRAKWTRATGAGYTAGSATSMRLRHVTFPGGIVMMDTSNIAMLTNPGPTKFIGINPSFNSTIMTSIIPITPALGLALELFMVGGDVSGGDGGLGIELVYELWS